MAKQSIFVVLAIIVGLTAGLYGYWSAGPTNESDALHAQGSNNAGEAATKSALPSSADHVSVHSVLQKHGDAGQRLIVALDIEDGWHVNANPASMEFLIPTTLEVEHEAEPVRIAVDYPAGTLLEAGFDKPIAVYNGSIALSAKLPGAAKPYEPETLKVKVNLQACNDTGRCLIPSELVTTVETAQAQ